MKVEKRNGGFQEVSFDKVIERLKNMCQIHPVLKNIDIYAIAQKVCSNIYDGVKTSELDELAAQLCTSNITKHPEFGVLASRIIISNNHKFTSPSFSETIYDLYNNKKQALVSRKVYDIVMKNKNKFNSHIDYSRDYLFDYFGFKTLEKAYLLKIDGRIVERISHMVMRVAIGIHGENIKLCLESYDYMSQKYFTHATPTLFHSGTDRPQLLSCFLMGMHDSVSGIYKTISDCAQISKWAGGIGVWSHDIRGTNALIKSTSGRSNGIIPMLKVFNETARHINQSGKRNGSFAFYLEPWHTDIMDFLEAKKNHGDENKRARDLFYGLWIPDLFMEKVEKDEDWYLMCPDNCKLLSNTYGKAFNKAYENYLNDDSIVKKKVKAREVWKMILISQIETGTPYMLYKNSCNSKSNQQNLGTIKSSNLCTEIIEYSDHKQYACCTLSSIGLSRFVVPYDYSKIEKVVIYSKENCKFCRFSKSYFKHKNISFTEYNIEEGDNRQQLESKIGEFETVPQIFIKIKDQEEVCIGGFDSLITYFKPTFDFNLLGKITRIVTRNLNKIIDINFYPVPETRFSNKLHRPIGIGIQGLADVFSLMKISFDSPQAKLLNKQIFATIYYFSLLESNTIAMNRLPGMTKLFEEHSLKPTNFIEANQYKLVNERMVWTTGNNLPENSELENELLPIHEEFNISNKNLLGAYSSFEGSPLSKGQFQFDLWNTEPLHEVPGCKFSWEELRQNVMKYGCRNSLLLAPMPTASTSQILGNNECIEPITSNIYSRTTIAGSFIIVNKYLLEDLIHINLWNNELKNEIIKNNGSIQEIENIPDCLKKLYKTAWDLSQKTLIDLAADRGIYICQSQSLNLWLNNPDFSKLTSMHFYGWKKGLKTGIYYLRTKSKTKAQQFTIEPEVCEMCSA